MVQSKYSPSTVMEKFSALDQKKYYQETDKILKDILYQNHHTKVARPATLKDGVIRLNATQRRRFRLKFKKLAKNHSYTDFIPASGSGSRLLKDLVVFAKKYDPREETVSLYINRNGSYQLNDFFKHLKNLPFYDVVQDDISQIMLRIKDINEARLEIVKFILETDKLNLSNLPKALVPIHKYNRSLKNAMDEHLDLHKSLIGFYGSGDLVFTVRDQQREQFEKAIEKQFDMNQEVRIKLSIQDPESEVHCLDQDHKIVIGENGELLRQPSGHGALIDNLNDLDADVVHISSIDNVPNKINIKAYVNHKKIMAGYLLYVVGEVHKYLVKLENDSLTRSEGRKLAKFLKRYFHMDFKLALKQSDEGVLSTIYHLLNAPIRVAAMVPNTVDQGGRPFWVANSHNINTLQIVETGEIDENDVIQRQALSNATHYNPTSMFIYTKNYHGEKFDLKEFAVDNPCIVTQKSYNGEDIKFIEQPGLWNGRMRNYLTIFIQMDQKIFNPVRDLTDVLNRNNLSK